MKFLSNDQLKKLSVLDRQDLIIKNLETLRDKKLSYNDVKLLSVQIMKLYLLEKGESIDVDFSSRVQSIFK